MKDISSIVLTILAILSFGIQLFKKANRPESEPPAPAKRHPKPVSIDQKEEEESDMPILQTHEAPAKSEELKPEQTAKAPETPENSSISDDFDLAKAVIYSEILKPKFDEE